MMPAARPQFEVIVAATAAERRLVTVDIIRSLTGLTVDDASDAALALLIDAALATCARSCKLAKYRAYPLTLAQETVRATWTDSYWYWWRSCWPYDQPAQLLLPWRAPITSVAITEGETELVEDTDFQLLGAGVIQRIGGYWPIGGNIVVDYVAGFVPLSDDVSYDYDGETLPADVVALIADQVRMAYGRGSADLNLRSEDIPGVWSGSYNIAGGDAIDTSGLINTLYDALAPYRAPPSFA